MKNPKIPVPEPVQGIVKAVAKERGKAILVGGYVRDHLLGIGSKDADVEVFHVSLETLERILARFGEVNRVGRAFAVLRVKGIEADFSVPRHDSKTGPGHRGFSVGIAPDIEFEEAARRRDLTINSIGYDPEKDTFLDPFHGRKDLETKVLRATDPRHFAEDPLRGLRVAGFAARFDMKPDPELERLCSELDLSELPPERILVELDKILLKSHRPSVAFRFLEKVGLLRFFPEIEALSGVPQEADWHPEGDVFVHTMMVIDEATRLRRGDAEDRPLMYGALCHDFGKPATTESVEGRIRSRGHEEAGVAIAEAFLERLRAPNELVMQVGALVRHHLAPGLYSRMGAKPRAYRRLARELEATSVTMELLLRVAIADSLGRTTSEALERRFEEGDQFRKQMEALDLEEEGPRDVVQGRHLIARGFAPGKHFREILSRCRDVQDQTGWKDPDRILDEVMKYSSSNHPIRG
ncbi:MAG TPA: HDIG domain-containing protein [Vicinamibacteria bacterium]|nr:HDIG domain-containing protein [Vicinamibacteria bacterium]